jgi:anti-sigma factor RsiW
MEITPHLSEVELAEFISDPSRGLGTHLAHCDACLYEVARMRETVAGLRELSSEPDEYWVRQRMATRTVIATAPSRHVWRFPRFAWAGAMAVIVLAGLLVGGGSVPSPAPVVGTDPAADPAANNPDHQLLLAVEHVMQSSGPEALEPAAYLVREINRNTRPHAISKIHNGSSPPQFKQGDSQ